MRINAFAALRPVPEAAARVAAPPYDTMDRAEAKIMAAGNPDHFLHVSRAEIDFPETVDAHDERVYGHAREALRDLERRGVLFRDQRPGFYLYRQRMGEHSQIGVVACCHVDDYREHRILRHEKTRPDKEDDRTRHILALRAHIGPVFLTYRDCPDVTAMVDASSSSTAIYDFTAPDGVRHTVWRLDDAEGERLQASFERIPVSYVADGHHRAAAAARAGLTLRATSDPAGDGEAAWFLAVLFPASQLQILPYHRCVADLNGLTPSEFLDRVREHLTLTSDRPGGASGPGSAGMYVAGRWHHLSWPRPSDSLPPSERLDVAVLQRCLLSPVLAVDDPRNDPRMRFVGGVRGMAELERLVDRGDAAVAFAMWPVTVDEVMRIADAGVEMPPKSTWFEPKVCSGLLVHTF